MSGLYVPSTIIQGKLENLSQGFLMDVKENGTPVLILKFDASVLTAIINGCRLEIIICHHDVFKLGAVLMIYDNVKHPLHISIQDLGPNHPDFIDYPEVLFNLIEIKKLKLVLFNEALMPVFNTELEVNFKVEDWEGWLEGDYSEKKLGNDRNSRFTVYPECSDNGFIITINNLDHSKRKLTEILFYDQPEVFSKLGNHFNFSNYLTDGKHGYNQEYSLFYTLSPFFTPDVDLFVSPQKEDGTEFADFVILLDDAYLIIESKFILSPNRTKLIQQLRKAVKQLKVSDELIMSRTVSLENKVLEQALLKRKVNLRLCIYNDSVYLTPEKCRVIINKYDKIDLPFFISITGLKEMLAKIYLLNKERFKSNMLLNLKRFFISHQDSDREILIIDGSGTVKY